MPTIILSHNPCFLPNPHLLQQNDKLQKQHWRGRILTFPGFINGICESIGYLAYPILFSASLIFDSPQATTSLFKKISRNFLPLIEELRELPNRYAKFTHLLESSISIINIVQIGADIDYLANAKYVKDSLLAIAGKILLFIAHAGESLLWVARTAGQIRLINVIAKFKINVLAEGTLAISHFFLSIDAFSQLIREEDGPRRNYQKIEMAKNAAECTLAIVMISSCIFSTVSIHLLAGLCIGLELAGLIHKEKNGINL
jgi:hypothetical protein